jgi:glycosyltransferase involved in cell wall biosynthesis
MSVIVPAYNEERGVQEAVESLMASLSGLELDIPYQVIVVNDGSRDRTAEILEGLSYENLTVVEHETNRGYGAALKTGISNADYPWILITDADGTYPPTAIGDLLSNRQGEDMVVGARTSAVSNIPLIRRPPKWVLRKLASYLSRQRIPDLNSGLRLMRRSALERFLHILPSGFSFTTTITLAMFSEGLRVKYVPIDYLKRKGASKIRPIYDTINFLQLIIRTVMYFDPLRVFLPVSATFVLASVAVGAGSFIFLPKMLDATTVLLFVTGVQLLAIGVLADIINKRLGQHRG